MMAQLKPAAKILIGLAIIAPLGYFGSQYLDKMPTKPATPATEQVQPQEVTAVRPDGMVVQAQVPPQATPQLQVQAAAEVQAQVQQAPAESNDAGLGALLNSGKK